MSQLPDDQWAEELLKPLHSTGCPFSKDYGKCLNSYCYNLIKDKQQAILTRLALREVESKIAELKYWQWRTDGHIDMSGKEADDRIKQLEQQQSALLGNGESE
jgi:hypothetical protein